MPHLCRSICDSHVLLGYVEYGGASDFVYSILLERCKGCFVPIGDAAFPTFPRNSTPYRLVRLWNADSLLIQPQILLLLNCVKVARAPLETGGQQEHSCGFWHEGKVG